MARDYVKIRDDCDRSIRRNGGVAILRRQGAPDRQCLAFVTSFNPRERPDLTNPIDRQALVSALAPDGTLLDPEPDFQVDRLVTLDQKTGAEKETLVIFEPVNRMDPGGVILFFQLSVRK